MIFDGTIKQYRRAQKPVRMNTYLDILAADDDEAYNFAYCSRTLAADYLIRRSWDSSGRRSHVKQGDH